MIIITTIILIAIIIIININTNNTNKIIIIIINILYYSIAGIFCRAVSFLGEILDLVGFYPIFPHN